MNSQSKNKVRADFALKKISEPVILDSKLLKEQIKTVSELINITNDNIADTLVGAIQILEMFEWLPKGEYEIKIKIM